LLQDPQEKANKMTTTKEQMHAYPFERFKVVGAAKWMKEKKKREFAGHVENKNVITFFKPSSLIFSPNGADKTTIIECLKLFLHLQVVSHCQVLPQLHPRHQGRRIIETPRMEMMHGYFS